MTASTRLPHVGSAQTTAGSSARSRDVPPKQRLVVCATNMAVIPTKQIALFQAVATTLLEKDCARNMAPKDSALMKDVMQVCAAMVFASSTLSALGNGAPRPLLQGEGVANTVVAARKCAI